MEKYKRYAFLGIILTSLGVIYSTTMKDIPSLGPIFIAIGALFLIVAMKKKNEK